jgi:dephospho-CoA kinase
MLDGKRFLKLHKTLPLIIALTGGIGSGKSTVANLFADLGVPIIDADQISRELVVSGSPLLEKITSYFGNRYIDDLGNLLREKLRSRIFESEKDRLWLESLLHPAIYEIIKERAKAQKVPYVICVIPLLFETDRPDFIDKVIVVDLAEELQIKRVSERDNISEEEIRAIINSQCSRKERLKKADEIIKNNGDIALLKLQVGKIHKKYLKS